MVKVITYGTYDRLHYGHIRLLERAKALGDYLIVGVTSDDYDKVRGKINNQQSLMERIEAVKAAGLADEVIVEEYDGQKIDDIKRYGVDIFTLGSDWEGKFDYLNDYCKVIYLPRTEGISSSQIRDNNKLKIRIIGHDDNELTSIAKFTRESSFVDGIEIIDDDSYDAVHVCSHPIDDDSYDAVYVCSHPSEHYKDVKNALEGGKHVLCESPIALKESECRELFQLARQKGLVLLDGIKTAYTTAFERLVLLAKSGKIGEILSVDATCTSIKNVLNYSEEEIARNWNTITEWGPIALLPIFRILGTEYDEVRIASKLLEGHNSFDVFSKIDFDYISAVASLKIAKSAKSEGELIITGTKGYIYVPAPWWKTEYFELRYEDAGENKRYFYQLEGEGIRYEIVAFVRAVRSRKHLDCAEETAAAERCGQAEDAAAAERYGQVEEAVSAGICGIIGDFYDMVGRSPLKNSAFVRDAFVGQHASSN